MHILFKKNLKYYLNISSAMEPKHMLLMLMIVLVGCQQAVDDHMGCAPGEIAKNGCELAEENNADIFEQKNEAEVITENVNYGSAVGFLARPKQDGKYPAVVMIHEWWGLNENIKDMAILLAQEGYVVLAVDLYNGNVATTQDEARTL